MSATPPWGVAARRRWAIRIIVRILVAPSSVSDDERAAVASWLDRAVRGGELRAFDLRAAMDARGLNAEDFAAAVGVTGRLVRYWLRGERVPTRDTARRIGKALNEPAARILTGFAIRKNRTKLDPYDPTRPLVGRNLAAARLLCKLTKAQLAAIAAVELDHVSRCEAEAWTPPTWPPLLEIQRAVANRLRRRGHRTITKVDRRRRGQPLGGAEGSGQEAAPPA